MDPLAWSSSKSAELRAVSLPERVVLFLNRSDKLSCFLAVGFFLSSFMLDLRVFAAASFCAIFASSFSFFAAWAFAIAASTCFSISESSLESRENESNNDPFLAFRLGFREKSIFFFLTFLGLSLSGLAFLMTRFFVA